MALKFGQQDASLEIERDISTPVEHRREETLTERYNVTRKQARAFGWSLALVVPALVFLVASFGPRVAEAAWGVGGLVLLFYWLYNVRYEVEDDEGNVRGAVELPNVMAGLLVLALSGAVAWLIWRLAAFLMPPLPWEAWGLPQWSHHLVPWVHGLLALWSLVLLVFCVGRAGFLLVAFGQQAIWQSSFVERAVARILAELGVYHGKKYQPTERRTFIYGNTNSGRPNGDNGKEAAKESRPLPPARIVQSDIEAFLVDGDRIGYSRRAWVGRNLSNGTRVTDALWRQLTEDLVKAGWMASDNRCTRLTQPLSLVLAGLSPAPPRRVIGGGGDTSPTHPPTHPPTHEDLG